MPVDIPFYEKTQFSITYWRKAVRIIRKGKRKEYDIL